jgi:hypothetical protein
VQDVVYRGDGTPASGTLVISWGNSGLARAANNYFGIKGRPGGEAVASGRGLRRHSHGQQQRDQATKKPPVAARIEHSCFHLLRTKLGDSPRQNHRGWLSMTVERCRKLQASYCMTIMVCRRRRSCV